MGSNLNLINVGLVLMNRSCSCAGCKVWTSLWALQTSQVCVHSLKTVKVARNAYLHVSMIGSIINIYIMEWIHTFYMTGDKMLCYYLWYDSQKQFINYCRLLTFICVLENLAMFAVLIANQAISAFIYSRSII